MPWMLAKMRPSLVAVTLPGVMSSSATISTWPTAGVAAATAAVPAAPGVGASFFGEQAASAAIASAAYRVWFRMENSLS